MTTALIDVVGLTFVDGYPENLHRIDEVEPFMGDEELAIVLIRNPANQYDANAIEVHVPSMVGMVGHIPKHTAARMAPRIDAGQIYRAWIEGVRVNPDHPDRPGLTIGVRHHNPEGNS